MKQTKKYCVNCGSQMKYAPVPNNTFETQFDWEGNSWGHEHGPSYDTKTGAQLLWEKWICPKTVTIRFLFWKMEDPCSEVFGKTVKA